MGKKLCILYSPFSDCKIQHFLLRLYRPLNDQRFVLESPIPQRWVKGGGIAVTFHWKYAS